MDQVELLSLPHEVLLSVLAYLSPLELLRCRVLCRRLRDLCLHRQLWSRVSVGNGHDERLLRAALNLAPCLRKISASVSLRTLAHLVQGTECVVAELDLTVRNQEDAALASLIVVKLSAVGGLKKLKLNLACPSSALNLPMLLKAVLSLNRTVELWVSTLLMNEPAVLPDPCYDLEILPCMTKLTYLSRQKDPFLLLLLMAHAASLQDISFDPKLEAVIAQLAGIPNLRTLSCSASDGLSELVNLANLQEITLIIQSPDPSPGALQFLREASQLLTVRFEGQIKTPAATALLLALAQSPAAALIEKIYGVHVTEDLVQSVAPVLQRFPSLQFLEVVTEPPNGLLKAISPESLPHLTWLVVRVRSLKPPEKCLHLWLHHPAIQDLLVRNPRLHLRLHLCMWARMDVKHECVWCGWGCHALLRRYSAYSSHARKASCPAECFQVAGATGQ